MKKLPARTATKPAGEVEAIDKRSIDPTRFKPDVSARELERLLGPIGHVPTFPFPIETLSCTRTLGRGRTNLTIIVPTIVQIDTPTPRASFNRRTTSSTGRNPTIQMHFEPIAYGITSVATYIMEFTIQAEGQSTFNLAGGAVPVVNGGTKVLNGQTKVSLIFPSLAPTEQVFGFLEQTAGEFWHWFSVQVRFPPPVLTQ